jgi:uncharacterized membrane protein YfcA
MQAPVELAMLSTAVFLGGMVSGFSGFAFSAAAGAILLHVFEPIAAIPLMMFCSIASQAMSLVKVYRFIRWRELAPLLIGGMAGAAVAVPFMAAIQPHAFRIAFGVFLASYALYMLTRHSLTRRPLALAPYAASGPALSVVGFTAGAVGSLTAMPGALMVVWCELRGLSKENQRALVQPFIIAVQIFAIGLYCLQPHAIGVELFRHLALALPAVGLGTFIGMSMFSKVNDRIFRCSALLIILASGCLMVFV